jgi:hypothetical protein
MKITYVVTCAIEAVHREENGVTSFGETAEPVKVFETSDPAKAHQFLEAIQNLDNPMIHDADGVSFITTEGLCSHCHRKLTTPAAQFTTGWVQFGDVTMLPPYKIEDVDARSHPLSLPDPTPKKNEV